MRDADRCPGLGRTAAAAPTALDGRGDVAALHGSVPSREARRERGDVALAEVPADPHELARGEVRLEVREGDVGNAVERVARPVSRDDEAPEKLDVKGALEV